jgi:hypothetical protein
MYHTGILFLYWILVDNLEIQQGKSPIVAEIEQADGRDKKTKE